MIYDQYDTLISKLIKTHYQQWFAAALKLYN